MDIIPSLISLLESSKYFLIFAGSYLEGSAVMMTTGLLWHLGRVEFLPAYTALFLGDILSDTMWYTIGHYAARPFLARWGHLFGMDPEVIEKVKRRFHHYHTKILVISKLTMGFGLAVPILMVAGMLHVPFSRFLLINVVCGVVWILALMGIGYYFGNLLVYIPKNLQVTLAVAIPLLFFFALREITQRLKSVDW
jgi:membrane protein DedA with SNARE-associated domain